jgi:tetratricopeptide (TPR) repeat protein
MKSVVYSEEGVHREELKNCVSAVGYKPAFSSDTSVVSKLVSEIKPEMFMLHWESLDDTRAAQLLRQVSRNEVVPNLTLFLCCENVTPQITAICGEVGVRRIITFDMIRNSPDEVSKMLTAPAETDELFNIQLKTMRDKGESEKRINKFIEAKFKQSPDSPDIRLEYGNSKFNEKDDSTAKDIAVKLLEEDSSNSRAMNLLARVCMRAGDFAAAETVLKRADILSPKDPSRLTLLGNVYFNQDKLAEATAAYEGALEAEKGNMGAVTGLADVKLSQGDTDALVQLFSVHSTESEMAGFFNNSAVYAVHEGNLEESIKLYKIAVQAIESNHLKAIVYFNMSLNYRRQKNIKEAIKATKRAIKYDPNYEKAKIQLETLSKITK